jgi:hypothetical protein
MGVVDQILRDETILKSPGMIMLKALEQSPPVISPEVYQKEAMKDAYQHALGHLDQSNGQYILKIHQHTTLGHN